MRKLMFCATMVAMMLCFASCKEKAREANCIIDGHECVDMGLSVKWATCNVGASSPEEVGDYLPGAKCCRRRNIRMKTASHTGSYYWQHRRQCLIRCCHGQLERQLANTHRRRTAGVEKQMSHQWVRNGVEGCLFMSRKTGNSLFLPAAEKRCRYEELDEAFKGKHKGYYWSASPNITDSNGWKSWYFHFDILLSG